MNLEYMLYVSILTIIFMMLMEGTLRTLRVLITKTQMYRNSKTETGFPVRNKTNTYIFKIARYSTSILIFLWAYMTYAQVSGVSGFYLFGVYMVFKLFLHFSS